MDKITEERARACYIVHRGACEQWTHGEPAEVWRDENHVLCVRYSDNTKRPAGAFWVVRAEP